MERGRDTNGFVLSVTTVGALLATIQESALLITLRTCVRLHMDFPDHVVGPAYPT